MKPRWIFLDVGYTLLDETPAWVDLFARLAASLTDAGRLTLPDEVMAAYRRVCVSFAPKQWLGVCEAIAPCPASVPVLADLNRHWRHDFETPYSEVESTLAELARHFRLGIIANQFKGTRDRLAQHGLLPHLSLVISSAEAGVTKPDPQIFELALREADCRAEDAVMVGDRLDNDIRPAKLLGMKTIHVRQGGSGAQRPRDADDVASATIDRIDQLTPALIQSL